MNSQVCRERRSTLPWLRPGLGQDVSVHLYAAIAPPAQTRLDLARLVQQAGVATSNGRSGRRWFARGERPTEDGAAQVAGMFDRVADDNLVMEVAGFGNLNNADASRLIALLTEAAREWPPLRLRVAGGVVLDWPGDNGAWGSLDGDTDGVSAMARGTFQVAQRLQVFVDRRRFRPLIKVGTITDATTAPYLEALLADLESYEGAWWQQTVLPVWQLSTETAGPRLRPYAEVPLSG